MSDSWISSIKAKLLLVGGAPVLATGVIAVLGVVAMGRIGAEVAAMTERALPASLLAMRAQTAASDALRHTRGAMITTDDAERTRLLADGRTAAAVLGEAVDGLGTVELSAEAAAAAARLRDAGSRYTAQLGEVWKLLAQNSMIGTEQATDLAREKLPPLTAAMDEATGTLERLTAEERGRATGSVVATLARARAILTWGPGAGLVLAAGIGLLTARSLAAGLSRLNGRLERIAARRDPLEDRRLDDREPGELGALARSYNRVAEDVRGIVGRVTAMSTDVNEACSQIAAATEQTNATIRQQSERVHDIRSALDELAGHLTATTTGAGEARAAVTGAGAAAGAGEAAVTRTIEGVRLLREAVSAGAQSVDRLGKKSEQVGAIIGVIDDIADQTNLLALNAAIEAARAGQHGRGFAVVADEVRKLAERTTLATKQVSDTIRMIQEETTAAVTQMNGGTGRADESLRLAESASSALAEIVRSVGTTIGSIDAITRGAESQRELGESIRRDAGTIVSSSDEAARGSAQSAEAVAGLLAKAGELARTIDGFAAGTGG